MVRKYRKYDDHLFDIIEADNRSFCEIAMKQCTKTDCSNCQSYIDLMRHLDNPKAPA